MRTRRSLYGRQYDKLDHSDRLSRLITWLSRSLAARRGLPLVTAVALTLLSLVVHILWVITSSVFLGICATVLIHVALLIGFLGILLAEPIGRG